MRISVTRLRPVSVLALLLSGALITGRSLHGAEGDEALIVECTRPCAGVIAAVVGSGGEVTQQYDNVDAVAVRVPSRAVAGLVALAGADSVRKDAIVSQPVPETFDVTDQLGAAAPLTDTQLAALDEAQPTNYSYNLTLTNVAGLHASGHAGQNVVVAVIDSGTTNVAPNLLPTLALSVIGGESFVPPAQDPLSATHHENGSHGTATATMIASHAAFLFANTTTLVRALNLHAPGSAIACSSLPPGTCPTTHSIVRLTGTAPGAKIYAMKVFSARGGGAPESRIIAAMDRAITLRKNFNAAGANVVASGTGTETDPFVYSALRIDVVNMSLGGTTLFAGRDLEDQLTIEMVKAGITLAVSAGNDGFGAMTIGSPGTGLGSLTVGAANTSVHERVLRDNQFGFGAGALYRASDHTQTAYFSSRGPNADGRNDPDITANGFASFVLAFAALTNVVPPAVPGITDCRSPNAAPNTCVARFLFVSGTSFSSPTVAGGAAVLREKHRTAGAAQIRNALHESANPTALGDDSTRIDQGKGLLDVGAADALLSAGNVSSRLPDLSSSCRDHDHGEDELGAGGSSVSHNVRRAGFRIAHFQRNQYTTTLSNLKPGEVAQIFVPSDFLTSNLTVTIDNVVAELPPPQQNQFFGDDVFVTAIRRADVGCDRARVGFRGGRSGCDVSASQPSDRPRPRGRTGRLDERRQRVGARDDRAPAQVRRFPDIDWSDRAGRDEIRRGGRAGGRREGGVRGGLAAELGALSHE